MNDETKNKNRSKDYSKHMAVSKNRVYPPKITMFNHDLIGKMMMIWWTMKSVDIPIIFPSFSHHFPIIPMIFPWFSHDLPLFPWFSLNRSLGSPSRHMASQLEILQLQTSHLGDVQHIYLSICLSIYLSIYTYIHTYIYIYVYVYVWICIISI